MKILCLHGNGTNSSVMELQTAPLRHELDDGHEYEFVEAVFPAAMSAGIGGLSSPGHSFYAYYDPGSLDSLQSTLTQLKDYVATEGPFDAIMGFSAGAVLAAAYILQVPNGSIEEAAFKCAVFLSSAVSKAELKYLGLDGRMIQIPTAHIWGSNDDTAPTGGQDISRLCNPRRRFVYTHDGAHEVPRKKHLTEAVHTIRRTVGLAMSGERL
ncbi:serine hydrolase FSH [Xylariomycetidae sp. FL0641]|nr:serine hydrolase FSH [Xylariomycetidae sp. FL0641]